MKHGNPIPAPDEGYLDSIVLEDDEDGDGGLWTLCGWCDGSWRPGDSEVHEPGCPVPEVRVLRRMLYDQCKAPTYPTYRIKPEDAPRWTTDPKPTKPLAVV